MAQDWDGKVPKPAILKPQPLWTGKQVFSMMLPKVNLKRTSAWAKDADDHDFSVEDTGGDRARRVGHGYCVRKPWVAVAVVSFTSRGKRGSHRRSRSHFSDADARQLLVVAPRFHPASPIDPLPKTMFSINNTITKAKTDVKEVIKLAQNNELELQPGMTMQQSFEQKVNQILNKARITRVTLRKFTHGHQQRQDDGDGRFEGLFP